MYGSGEGGAYQLLLFPPRPDPQSGHDHPALSLRSPCDTTNKEKNPQGVWRKTRMNTRAHSARGHLIYLFKSARNARAEYGPPTHPRGDMHRKSMCAWSRRKHSTQQQAPPGQHPIGPGAREIPPHAPQHTACISATASRFDVCAWGAMTALHVHVASKQASRTGRPTRQTNSTATNGSTSQPQHCIPPILRTLGPTSVPRSSVPRDSSTGAARMCINMTAARDGSHTILANTAAGWQAMHATDRQTDTQVFGSWKSSIRITSRDLVICPFASLPSSCVPFSVSQGLHLSYIACMDWGERHGRDDQALVSFISLPPRERIRTEIRLVDLAGWQVGLHKRGQPSIWYGWRAGGRLSHAMAT